MPRCLLCSTFKSSSCQQLSLLFIQFSSLSFEPHLKSQNVYRYRRKAVIDRPALTFPNCYPTLCTPFSDMESSREQWQHRPGPCNWSGCNLLGCISIQGLCLLKHGVWSLLALTLPSRMWLIDCSELDIWPKVRKYESSSWKLKFITIILY